MIDVALGIEALIPSAQYFGSTTANDKESFDNLDWVDERSKPTWNEIQTAYDALPDEVKDPKTYELAKKQQLLDRLGISAEEAKLLLS